MRFNNCEESIRGISEEQKSPGLCEKCLYYFIVTTLIAIT